MSTTQADNPTIKSEEQKVFAQWTAKRQDKRTCRVFFFLAIFFTVLGILLAVYTAEVKEARIRYDDKCTTFNTNCPVVLTVEDKLEAPVYIYYMLKGFNQNHRKYVTSKDEDQLKGKARTISELAESDSCEVYVKNEDASQTVSVDGPNLVADEPLIPCGLIAATYFNDEFSIKDPDGNAISISDAGIAWDSDDEKYKNIDLSKQWLDMTKNRFKNWMKVSGRDTFRKLWGVISTDIGPGDYTITIANNYALAKQAEAEKHIILSTVNAFGGKNVLLTVCYLVAAFISWIIFFVFLHKSRKDKKKTA